VHLAGPDFPVKRMENVRQKNKPQGFWPCGFLFLVEHSGIEPLTSTLPVWRSPKVSGVHHHKTQPAYVDIYSAAESLLKL